MFTPEYRITDYFLSLIERIAAIGARIDAKNIKLPLIAYMQKDAICRGAHSSTSIEGNTLSLPQVNALSEKKDVPADFKQKQEVRNYLDALRWVIAHATEMITEKRMLALHKTVVSSLVEEDKAGAYKSKQNYVVNAKQIVIHRPPGPGDCPKLVRELVSWLDSSTDIHPIIQSAVFHHQFVTIHPFSDGNGRMARLLARWLLYYKGWDPHHIISLDDFYAENRERYYEKIQQARELDYDFTHWIEYVAEGILETTEKVYSRIGTLISSREHMVTLTPKQEEVIQILSVGTPLSSRALMEILKVNRARVNQLLAPLVDAGIIAKKGHARATRYMLNSPRNIH